MTETIQKENKTVFKVSRSSLPACCPPKDQAHWNMHPRVYLELEESGQADCPYCGNHFELVDD